LCLLFPEIQVGLGNPRILVFDYCLIIYVSISMLPVPWDDDKISSGHSAKYVVCFIGQ
jgi:hypothetical protein